MKTTWHNWDFAERRQSTKIQLLGKEGISQRCSQEALNNSEWAGEICSSVGRNWMQENHRLDTPVYDSSLQSRVYRRVPRKSHMKSNVGDLANMWKMLSDLLIPKYNFLFLAQSTTFHRNPTLLIIMRTQWSMVVVASWFLPWLILTQSLIFREWFPLGRFVVVSYSFHILVMDLMVLWKDLQSLGYF